MERRDLLSPEPPPEDVLDDGIENLIEAPPLIDGEESEAMVKCQFSLLRSYFMKEEEGSDQLQKSCQKDLHMRLDRTDIKSGVLKLRGSWRWTQSEL